MKKDYQPVRYKTPLRYPGGKSRAIKFLHKYLPSVIQSYTEPFLGGGSMALYITQTYPNALITVNDSYKPLWCFWTQLQKCGKELMHELIDIKKNTWDSVDDQKSLFKDCKKILQTSTDDYELAKAFYIVNKCSFSGLSESSSFSRQAYEGNFTLNNIKKLTIYQDIIKLWNITNLDYAFYMQPDYEQDFIFLDPPYDIKSFLYGKDGSQHKGFDHDEFKNHIDNLDRWQANFMVTYNSNPHTIELYKTYHCLSWDLKYTFRSTGTYMQDQKERKELLIYNYEPN